MPAEEQPAFVQETCADEEIRIEVLALLDASAVDSDFLGERFNAIRERLWSDVVAMEEPEEESLTGQRVGHWLIKNRLARGGLATVYLAHRDDGEFDQTVAFKVLRRGLDTDDVVARFRSERQILSSLDHPAIGQIFDGGALPDGRPYLVLEFVDGEPITAYCASHDVDIRRRIKFVIEILRALGHAHKHTVVHRDIKPSNILVSTEGNVVLLDFGIAKLLDPEAMPGTSTQTRTGVSLLTPGYGSPEQRAGQPVTTSSDIYQVGVVLYELLAGSRPLFTRRDGETAEPGPPSQHLKGTQHYAEVRGDLDAIVGKAMHADPGQRYGSAGEMVADLERYLDGRPVVAQPDTLGYRLRKLTKRRPWLLPGTTIIVLGIAAYIVTLTLYSRQLQLEQQRAEAAQAFMVDLFSSPDPYSPADPERGRNITVVEALELGRRRLESGLVDQPELRATLLSSVAGMYQSLDQNEAAIELGEEALALNLEIHGEDSEPVLENLRLLGISYNKIADYDRARNYNGRQLAIARRLYLPKDARLGAAEVAMGSFEMTQGNEELAVDLLMSGIEKLRTDPPGFTETLITAIIASTQREGIYDPEESLALLDEALAVAKDAYGRESLQVANVLIAQGRIGLRQKNFEQARERYSIGLTIYDARLGPNHVDTVIHYNNYGVLLISAGEYAGAEEMYRELVPRFIALRGEEHRLVADNYQNLATAIARQGRLDEALPLHRKAYDVYKASNWEHFRTDIPLLSIAYIELQLENAAAAEAAAITALNTFRDELPGTYLEGVALCLAGLSKERQGDLITGTPMVEASHALILQVDLTGTPYPELCRVPAVNAQ